MAKQIGDILVEKGLVTPEELQRALAEQEKTGEFLGSALIRMGCISEEQLLQSLSEQLNIPFVNLKHLTIDRAVIQRVPADRKSTRLNSSHANISYAVFCLKKKKTTDPAQHLPLPAPHRPDAAERQ